MVAGYYEGSIIVYTRNGFDGAPPPISATGVSDRPDAIQRSTREH